MAVLFTKYLFDLVELTKLDRKLFADDCKIYANPITSAELLQADLQNIDTWSKSMGYETKHIQMYNVKDWSK